MPARHRIEMSIAAALVAMGVALGAIAPSFFSPGNLLDVLLALLPVLIVATGATFVMIAGDIDISAGSVFGVCSVVAGLLALAGLPAPAIIVATTIAGAMFGVFNGVLVAYAGLPSIIVTLAAMVAWRDGLRWATQGAWIQGLPPEFQWMGLSQAAYPWTAIAVAAVIVGCGAWVLAMLPAGRAVHATGSHAHAARLAGIDTRRVRLGAFTIAGATVGLAAVINAVRFSQIPPNTGTGLELEVIAAVVVGGTAITGGRGTIAGTVLGVVLLGVLGPALTFMGVSAFWERALQGVILLVAVASDALRARSAARPGTVAEAPRG